MKLLDEKFGIISTLSTPDGVRQTVEILSHSLKTVWMERNGFQFNADKIEWLWLPGSPWVGILLLLLLDEAVLWHSRQVHNLELLTNSYCSEQVAAVAWGTLVKVHLVHQCAPFSVKSPYNHSCSVCLTIGLLQSVLHGAIVKDHLEATAGLKWSGMSNNSHYSARVTEKLHWYHLVPWCKFMVFKAVYGIGSGYLRDCFSSTVSACQVHSGRFKRKHLFRDTVDKLILLRFHKALKTWLCSESLR